MTSMKPLSEEEKRKVEAHMVLPYPRPSNRAQRRANERARQKADMYSPPLDTSYKLKKKRK